MVVQEEVRVVEGKVLALFFIQVSQHRYNIQMRIIPVVLLVVLLLLVILLHLVVEEQEELEEEEILLFQVTEVMDINVILQGRIYIMQEEEEEHGEAVVRFLLVQAVVEGVGMALFPITRRLSRGATGPFMVVEVEGALKVVA
jgi:cell division protein FtsW (lipid II flippase)